VVILSSKISSKISRLLSQVAEEEEEEVAKAQEEEEEEADATKNFLHYCKIV
jgi:gas vesicle protein